MSGSRHYLTNTAAYAGYATAPTTSGAGGVERPDNTTDVIWFVKATGTVTLTYYYDDGAEWVAGPQKTLNATNGYAVTQASVADRVAVTATGGTITHVRYRFKGENP